LRHHGCAVFESTTDRRIYLDAGGKVTNTDSLSSPSGLNRITIGYSDRATNALFFDGEIAEVGVWDISLTDAEVAILAEGFSPLFVRPDRLKFYAPIVREKIDIVGGLVLSDFGSPTIQPHTRVFMPAPPMIISAPAAAAAGIASMRQLVGAGQGTR